MYDGTASQTNATHAALGPLLSKSPTIELWPFPSERRVYTYEGYIDAPTLETTTDLGCPDNFRDVVEEMTLAIWFRRRDVNPERAGMCAGEGRRLLNMLAERDVPDTGPIPPPNAFRRPRTGVGSFRSSTTWVDE